MAITQNTYTGNGSTVLYSFTFPYLETTDIKVSLNGVNTTAYTLANATTVQFNSAPANGAAIRIYRQTDDAGTKATFFPGSAIRSQDLNDNFLQVLYKSQETETFAASTDASAIQATANTALSNANTALTNSNSALTTANGIASTANTALSNSASAVSTANAALPKAGGTMTGDIVFNGTQTFPNSGLQLASTSQQGIVQLTNSTSSTSTTTAATPSSVKSAFDTASAAQTTANAALPLSGGTLTGNLIVPSLNGGPLAGTRNRIINGDMRIDQRATTVTTFGPYSVDRWLVIGASTGAVSVSRSTTAPAGFTNSVLINVTTADTSLAAGEYAGLEQRIEGLNTADLAFGTASASTVTASFWIRSTTTGTYCFSLTNSATNRSYVATYTINAANTWEYKTITIPGDTTGTWLTDNSVGLYVRFSFASGTTFQTTAGSWQAGNFLATSAQTNLLASAANNVYITGVQLEPGTVATPFERRSYGQELALCQRYFSWNGGSNDAGFFNVNSDNVAGSYRYPVAMRATPTVQLYNGTTVDQVLRIGGTGISATSGAIVIASPHGFSGINATSVGTGVGGAQFNVRASAEL